MMVQTFETYVPVYNLQITKNKTVNVKNPVSSFQIYQTSIMIGIYMQCFKIF